METLQYLKTQHLVIDWGVSNFYPGSIASTSMVLCEHLNIVPKHDPLILVGLSGQA